MKMNFVSCEETFMNRKSQRCYSIEWTWCGSGAAAKKLDLKMWSPIWKMCTATSIQPIALRIDSNWFQQRDYFLASTTSFKCFRASFYPRLAQATNCSFHASHHHLYIYWHKEVFNQRVKTASNFAALKLLQWQIPKTWDMTRICPQRSKKKWRRYQLWNKNVGT